MTEQIARAIAAELEPLIHEQFEKYATSIVENIRHQHDDMAGEIHAVSDHLDKALSKIDIMIARSDARVEAINHMVDNCLELSKTCSAATDKANQTVLVNCNTVQEEMALQKQTAEDYSNTIKHLQDHCQRLQILLDAERSERSSLHEAVTSIKNTVDILIGSSARPNININPKQ